MDNQIPSQPPTTPPPAQPPMPPTPPSQPDTGKKKLMLVEDEDSIRDLYKRQLEIAGFTVDAYPNGQTALNAVSQNGYDLILLDIMLPDVNGLQILKEVKENDKTKHTPVLMLTNLGQEITIKEGFALGAEGYLIKASYTPDQIIQEINNILAKKQAAPV